MLSVALLGADGAGKTSVGNLVGAELDVPVRYMYLGVNGEAASHALVTTRVVRRTKAWLGHARPEGGPPPVAPAGDGRPPSPRRRGLAEARSVARMVNRIAEEAYQQLVATWHLRRGRVVVFDRFAAADYWAHDMDVTSSRTLGRRLHGTFLRTCVRPPDEVIVLDAPAEVLFARKGEGTLLSLEARRREYLGYADSVPRADVVDASAPLDQVVGEVVAVIRRELGRRARGGAR